MTKDEKQAALKKNIAIVSATLDYLLDHYVARIILDDFDSSRDYYEQQKVQAEKYFKQRRLDRLEQQLCRLTEALKQAVDLKYKNYIKDITGFDLDIFEVERQHIKEIDAKGKIDTEDESRKVSLMLRVFELSCDESENIKRLALLLSDFYDRKSVVGVQKKKAIRSEIVNIDDGIEVETIKISFGDKPVHFNEREAIAPDGKRKLLITEWNDGKHPSTSVTIFFDNASGPIYSTNGIYSDVNAYWKDNNTILIETKEKYVNGLKHRKVQSFEDVIFIEYVEI